MSRRPNLSLPHASARHTGHCRINVPRLSGDRGHLDESRVPVPVGPTRTRKGWVPASADGANKHHDSRTGSTRVLGCRVDVDRPVTLIGGGAVSNGEGDGLCAVNLSSRKSVRNAVSHGYRHVLWVLLTSVRRIPAGERRADYLDPFDDRPAESGRTLIARRAIRRGCGRLTSRENRLEVFATTTPRCTGKNERSAKKRVKFLSSSMSRC